MIYGVSLFPRLLYSYAEGSAGRLSQTRQRAITEKSFVWDDAMASVWTFRTKLNSLFELEKVRQFILKVLVETLSTGFQNITVTLSNKSVLKLNKLSPNNRN